MAAITELKKAQERWEEHCRQIQSMTDTASLVREDATQKEQRIRRLLRDYAAFCEYYFPHFLILRDKSTGKPIRTIHNAPFHNQAARKVKSTPNLKAVFMWPRGHAKSTHFDIFMPLWLMFQPQRLINFMVIVGKSEDSADRLLGDIQAELQYNKRIITDFGEQMSLGNWMEGEFSTKQGVKFLAVGRGQSPRGLREREARPDYIVIDDLDDDELCRNERRVRELTEWVKEALFGALDVGRRATAGSTTGTATSSARPRCWPTSQPPAGCMSRRSAPSMTRAILCGRRNGPSKRRRSMPTSWATGHGRRR